jgi:hypothetical protein
MSEVTYVSRVRVDPVRGMIRWAHLPAEEDSVLFGAHGEIAEHYGASPPALAPSHRFIPAKLPSYMA